MTTTPEPAKSRAKLGPHRRAINAAVRAAGKKLTKEDAPLLELCKTLADQMDKEAADPSTRLSAAYLSALKDLRRTLDAAAHKPGGRAAAGPVRKTKLELLQDEQEQRRRAS